jgi:putative ABC transport system permease protein
MNPIRFALRSLRKSPGYTIIALITLALGIGVNTSMFSLVNELLFRVAPFPQGGEIHQVLAETRTGRRWSYSEVETREIREKASSFQNIAVINYGGSALTEPGRPAEQVQSIMVSPEIFEVFRTQPFLGRAFTAEEHAPGKNQVIILSYPFWQQRFAGSPDVIGRTLRVNGDAVTVIGVMPATFSWRMFWGSCAFWRPLNFTADQLKSRTYRSFQMVGRLKPGASPTQAATELATVATAQLKDFPQDYNGLTYVAPRLHEAQMDDESRSIVYMLLGLSGFVLLLACANLANLQLARATVAMREFAIRAALGASRARLIGQQLVECVILALGGGILGIFFGWSINRILSAAIRIGDEPGGLSLPIDVRVLAVTFVVAAVTGIIFGIVPAWLSSRTDVVTALKSQSRGSTGGRSQHRMRQLLIISEVALALVLLGGAAVMQRGFDKFIKKDVGWDTQRLLTGALSLREDRFPEAPARLEFFRKVEARLAALPGVEKVALTTGVPIWGFGNARKVFTEKMANADQANLPMARHVLISSTFFEVLGVPLVAGRGFTEDVKPGDPEQVVINETLARQLWPGQDPLGQRLATLNEGKTTWTEVIGIVRDTQPAADFGNDRIPGQIFRSAVHEPWSWMRFVIRAQSPETLRDSVRRAIAELDPDLPADDLLTVASAVDRSNHNLLVVAQILGGFAALGLVLAALGLYGVISNLVAQRTSEFGIRLALGARPADVLNLVLRHGVILTLIGLVFGLGGAYGLTMLLGSIMPRMVGPDPIALAGTAVILLLVALFACWLPARRATKVDPLTALRAE